MIKKNSFIAKHPWDRNFFLVMIGFAWVAILSGFINDIIILNSEKNPSAHKRLILIATLILTDAGFGRGISIWLSSFLGKPYWEYSNYADAFWPFFVRQLSCPFTLIILVGVYDLITRKKLHPAYVWGLFFAFSIDLTAGWLYFDPE
jgi:hypothetical protein